jgi:hypothetical protein
LRAVRRSSMWYLKTTGVATDVPCDADAIPRG